MGEKVKTLSKVRIKNSELEIELNHPLAKGKEDQIHIQSKEMRLEFDKKDYLKYALSVLLAERNLKILKNIK